MNKEYLSYCMNKGLSKARLYKISQMYKTCERLKPNIFNTTEQEIRVFIDNLNTDKYKQVKGKKYSGITKSDLKKAIKQYYKWKEGNNEYYPKKVAWINSKIAKDEQPKEKDILTYDELLSLARKERNPTYKIMLLLLFDSGFRISELLSVKKCNITWESFGEDKCFWIECKESKTNPRKVPIPLFTEDIKLWINSAELINLKPNDTIFSMSVQAITKHQHKVWSKHTNKHITSHNLRHSAATYYADAYEGDNYLLCEKFGWSYTSVQPARYIRKSGVRLKRGVKKTYNDDLSKIRTELKELKAKLVKSGILTK